MRQREDKDFAEIVNRIREGKHTDADIEVLKKRILNLSPQHPEYPINSTHLFSTNMAVYQHNHDIFHKSTNEKVEIKAIDIVLGDLSDELKERRKKQIPNDPSKTMGLYSVCSVLKDAKYDLTTNVSVVDGMTNGAECIIKKLITEYQVHHDQVLSGFYSKKNTLEKIIAKNILIFIIKVLIRTGFQF